MFLSQDFASRAAASWALLLDCQGPALFRWGFRSVLPFQQMRQQHAQPAFQFPLLAAPHVVQLLGDRLPVDCGEASLPDGLRGLRRSAIEIPITRCRCMRRAHGAIPSFCVHIRTTCSRHVRSCFTTAHPIVRSFSLWGFSLALPLESRQFARYGSADGLGACMRPRRLARRYLICAIPPSRIPEGLHLSTVTLAAASPAVMRIERRSINDRARGPAHHPQWRRWS